MSEISTSKTSEPDKVLIWQVAMAVGPVVACLAPFAIWSAISNHYFGVQLTKQSAGSLSKFAFLCAIWFAFAAFYFAQPRWNTARARAAAAWPTAPGIVEKSELKRVRGMYTGGYGYDLSYQYQVSDQKYEGNMVQFGPKSFAKRVIPESIVKKYPLGAAVQVHYNPAIPDIAVLETSAELAQRQSRWWFWISLAAPFVLVLPTIV